MQLNANQKKAVEYLSGPLLVLAGPGTGKTQLLSQKVAYILKHTDTNPENILCMTFTESGASNMRERLKAIIGESALKVHIGTYHAFGTDILAQYQNYSSSYERELTSAIDEVQRFKIVKDIQNKLPARDILRKDNVKDIISVISEAKSAGLSSSDLETVAKQNIEDAAVLSQAISPLLAQIVPRQFKPSFDNAYHPIYELLSKYAESTSTILNSPPIERQISIMARDLKSAIIEAESAEKIKPLSAWKDAYFEKDGKGNYRLKDRIANQKLSSLSKVMADYDTYLKSNGLFDFDDMIQEAVRVLKDDAGFRATMQEKYQFIMLDEFQDTNPSQFAIIKALTDYEQPQVMAVGDDDQAIYEFQGALSTNLTDFQNHYNSDVIALTDNYRSTNEILEFAHNIIKQAPDRFADKELTAHLADPEESQIHRYEFRSSDMEYAFVANQIATLIAKGVPQDQIAIISYKTKYFMPLLPYLKSHPEINIAYEKRDDLFEIEPIRQILTVGQYIWELAHEKRVDANILEILSYPWWHLPILEVVKLTAKAKHDKKPVFDYLGASEIAEIREVGVFLANLIAKSFTEPLEIWLDYLIGASSLGNYRSGFLEYYTDKDEYSTFSLYEQLASLRGKLRRHWGEKPLRLDDLVQMVNDYKEAEMPLNTTSPYRDADQAVQILSAHKAKGLEFQYVFMISVDHTAWGKGKGNNNLLSLPKNLTQIRHTGMTDGERLRVLYVALTRAKQGLIITNSLQDFNGKSPERLEYLQEYTEGEEVISPFLPTKTVVQEYQASASKIAENNLKNWLRPYAELNPDMRAIYQTRIQNWRMSASALTSFIDIVYAGPQVFFSNYILQAPREPETESLATGNLVHTVFEAITNQGLSDEQAVQLFLDELEARDLPADLKQQIHGKAPNNLRIALAEFGPILKQGEAEVNLAPDQVVINGVPITGKIDHLIIDKNTNTIEIYDFKTSAYHKEKWQSHTTLYKYMLQLGFYKLLLGHSPKYRKYHIKKAHILFVTPDKDDHVYDKIYEFNPEDEAELVKLITSVYQLVSTLEFMDRPDLFIPPDNAKKLSDIKAFIDLLIS